MALQNRVAPTGELISTPARGLFLGNRGGPLHDDQRRIVHYAAGSRWITCLLEFKGLRRMGHDAGPVHRAVLPR